MLNCNTSSRNAIRSIICDQSLTTLTQRLNHLLIQGDTNHYYNSLYRTHTTTAAAVCGRNPCYGPLATTSPAAISPRNLWHIKTFC